MGLFEFGGTTQAVLSLLIVVGMFIMFVRETYPTEVVAIGGVAFMLLTGVLDYQQGLAVLSNPAPWTIAAMFIVMGGWCAQERCNGSPRLPKGKPRKVRSSPCRP